LSLANALYGFFVLPESLPRDRRSPFSLAKANPLGALRLLRSHRELWGLSWVSFFSNLGHVALPSTAVLYMGYRYGWNEFRVGLLLASVGVCSILVQGVLVGPVVRAIGERRTLIVALIAGAAGFTVQALAPTGALYASGIVLMSLWGMMNPALQGLMTRLVAPTEQGRLQGANSSVLGISNLVGPVLFSQAFAYFIGAGRGLGLPGGQFLLSAMLLTVAAAIGLRLMATRLKGVSEARAPALPTPPMEP
jgi:DHA1 family tetracycline resistance protein-like MFS transporter